MQQRKRERPKTNAHLCKKSWPKSFVQQSMFILAKWLMFFFKLLKSLGEYLLFFELYLSSLYKRTIKILIDNVTLSSSPTR